MKGRRALPTAEALTGQKPRQRLTQTPSFGFLQIRKTSKLQLNKKHYLCSKFIEL